MPRTAVMGAVLALAIGVGTQAHADSLLGDPVDWSKMFSVSGFGTLGVTHSSLNNADYTNTLFQPRGAGASSNYSFGNTSSMGVQLNAQVTSRVSAVVQVISELQYNNSYSPVIEWANIKYSITPDLSVRIGRIALPSFMSADYRNVGYANVWAHAPLEVYDQLPITNSDGIDASYRMRFGRMDNTVQALYGETTAHVVDPASVFKAKASDLVGVFDTVEDGGLTLRAGYEHANVQIDALPLLPLTLYTAGAAYDTGRWFVQGEWARATVGILTPGYDAWYAMTGYRISKFTPYLLYSTEHSLNHPNLGVTNNGQTEYSVGVRWAVYRNMDIKLQYDRVTTPNNSAGFFTNLQPGFTPGSGANIVTAVFDFTF